MLDKTSLALSIAGHTLLLVLSMCTALVESCKAASASEGVRRSNAKALLHRTSQTALFSRRLVSSRKSRHSAQKLESLDCNSCRGLQKGQTLTSISQSSYVIVTATKSRCPGLPVLQRLCGVCTGALSRRTKLCVTSG